MKEDEFRTIKAPSEGLYKEKGSKFIALAFPVKDPEAVQDRIDEVRKKYHDARHHCYAYRLGTGEAEEFRWNDDGEPSGTAGRPIHGQLQSFELTNVLVVVVRYFGGTKLGTGGLIRAYKTATREALEAAVKMRRVILEELELRFEYPLLNEVMRIVKEEDLKITDQDFTTSCIMKVASRKSQIEKIKNKFEAVFGVSVLRINKN